MRPSEMRDRRVRVVHASSAHPWSDNRVHLREAAGLADAGYEVTLIAVERDVEIPATGVNVLTIPAYSRVKRVLWGTTQVVFKTLRLRPDIVHLHDPELVWAVPILRLLRILVVFDAHEDLPEQFAEKRYIDARLRRLIALLALGIVWIAGRSSMVVAATEHIAQRYPPCKTILVRNYPRLRELEKGLPPPSQRPRQIAYVGLVSASRGASVMIDAMDAEEFPIGWHLTLAGQTSPGVLLDELKSRPGWRNVHYEGLVGPMQARDISAQSRVGLVVLARTDAYLTSLPTKMFEYMAAGTPVIVSDFPLWREIVQTHDCGTIVDEKSPAAVARAIRSYAEDDETLDRHGLNARAAALRHLNWDHEERTLLEGYRQIRSAKRRSPK